MLGDLEQGVMELLWDVAPLAVREVQGRVAEGKLAYTTVMTTLDRLYKKGLLVRDKVGLAFVYRPAIERHEYQRRIVEAAVGPLLEHGARAVLAAFVDVAAENEDHLRQLEELIAARRKQRR